MVVKGSLVVALALIIFMLKSSYQTRVICAVALVGLMIFVKVNSSKR